MCGKSATAALVSCFSLVDLHGSGPLGHHGPAGHAMSVSLMLLLCDKSAAAALVSRDLLGSGPLGITQRQRWSSRDD